MKALGLYDFILRGFVWAYKWEGVYKQNKKRFWNDKIKRICETS